MEHAERSLDTGTRGSLRATGETEAFVSGVDSTVWHVRYDERRWQDWEGMGAPPTTSGVGIVGSPGAVLTFTGLADVFVRTSNNRIWAKAYANAHWSDWYVSAGVAVESDAGQ